MEKYDDNTKPPEKSINLAMAIQEALKNADISPKSSFNRYALEAIEKIRSDKKKAKQ